MHCSALSGTLIQGFSTITLNQSCRLGRRVGCGDGRLRLLQVGGVGIHKEVDAVGKVAVGPVGHALEHEAPAPLAESNRQDKHRGFVHAIFVR